MLQCNALCLGDIGTAALQVKQRTNTDPNKGVGPKAGWSVRKSALTYTNVRKLKTRKLQRRCTNNSCCSPYSEFLLPSERPHISKTIGSAGCSPSVGIASKQYPKDTIDTEQDTESRQHKIRRPFGARGRFTAVVGISRSFGIPLGVNGANVFLVSAGPGGLESMAK